MSRCFAVVVIVAACAVESTQPGGAGDCSGCADATLDTRGDAGVAHDAVPGDIDGVALPDVAADAPEPPDAADVSQAPDAPDALEPLTECPDSWLKGGEACVGPLGCTYGKECCCGQCDVSLSCSCTSGKMSCYYTDFCMGRFCSDGCPNQTITTPLGCTSCKDAYGGVHAALQELADSAGGCQTDADCQLAKVATNCGPVCKLGVVKTGRDVLEASAPAIDKAWCAQGGLCDGLPPFIEGYWEQPACQPAGHARCDEGQCRFAVPCDPAVQEVGSACDDGDACTLGDTCTEPFVCTGAPADCDDGDVCTDDSCDPATGCAHTENSAACTGFEGACSVGGQCVAGECQASPVPGFTREYPGPHRVVSAVDVVPGGALVLAGAVASATPDKGFVLRVAPTGEQLGAPLAVLAAVTDVVAFEDGGLLVAGEVLGQKDIALTRMDPGDEALWTGFIETPGADLMPRLAAHPSGTTAVVWSKSAATRVATISAAGEIGPSASLGIPSDQGSWPGVDGWPRIAPTASGFAVLHTSPTWSGEARTKVSLVDLTGTLTHSFVLKSSGPERPRGILWLTGDVLIAWGVRGTGADAVRWVRRLTMAGQQMWEHVGPDEEVAPWNAVALWTHGTAADGLPRLANLRIDTGEEVWSLVLPPAGVVVVDSVLVPDGIALAGTRFTSGWGTPWLRRTSWVQDCDGGVCPPPGCP